MSDNILCTYVIWSPPSGQEIFVYTIPKPTSDILSQPISSILTTEVLALLILTQ